MSSAAAQTSEISAALRSDQSRVVHVTERPSSSGQFFLSNTFLSCLVLVVDPTPQTLTRVPHLHSSAPLTRDIVSDFGHCGFTL